MFLGGWTKYFLSGASSHGWGMSENDRSEIKNFDFRDLFLA
jgi:hypothetical protein